MRPIGIKRTREIIGDIERLDLPSEHNITEVLIGNDIVTFLPQMLYHLTRYIIFEPFFVIDEHDTTVVVAIGRLESNRCFVLIGEGVVGQCHDIFLKIKLQQAIKGAGNDRVRIKVEYAIGLDIKIG